MNATLRFSLAFVAGVTMAIAAAGPALAHVAGCKGTLWCVDPQPGQSQTTCAYVVPKPGNPGATGCSTYGQCGTNCTKVLNPACPAGTKACQCAAGVPDHGGGGTETECDICFNVNSLGHVTVYSCTAVVCSGVGCEIDWVPGDTGTVNKKPAWGFDCLCR